MYPNSVEMYNVSGLVEVLGIDSVEPAYENAGWKLKPHVVAVKDENEIPAWGIDVGIEISLNASDLVNVRAIGSPVGTLIS